MNEVFQITDIIHAWCYNCYHITMRHAIDYRVHSQGPEGAVVMRCTLSYPRSKTICESVMEPKSDHTRSSRQSWDDLRTKCTRSTSSRGSVTVCIYAIIGDSVYLVVLILGFSHYCNLQAFPRVFFPVFHSGAYRHQGTVCVHLHM